MHTTERIDERLDSPLTEPHLFINRELSWLAFNERVLAQAHDPDHPLLERVRFLSITASNLDEFYMIRVATLLRRLRSGVEDVSPDGLSTTQQLDLVRRWAEAMTERLTACWETTLRPELAKHGIRLLDATEITNEMSSHLQAHFAREIFPVLTPLAFDPGHPFPHISNLSQNLAVVVRHGGRTKFARVKLPDAISRFVTLPSEVSGRDGITLVWLEDVIRANLHLLFPGAAVSAAHLFRVIRDADLVIQEDEADDLLETIDQSLKQRRLGALARLEVEPSMPQQVLDILVENFEVEDDRVFRAPGRLGLADIAQLTRLARPELKYTPVVPPAMWRAEDADGIFEDLRERDRLVHTPFQSFSAVETFVRAAASDPHVVGIKMTLYRIGTDSPLIDLLVEAAEEGKQVSVLVELKARFDERNNIKWAHRLEAAGVHVAYGLVNLKTHAKLCLVVRKDHDGIRRYAHIGTGNYNAETARVYTDIGLFTTRQAIVEDVADVFNYLTGYSNQREYRELLVAPVSLRTGLMELIAAEVAHAEAGRGGHIIIKCNALADHDMIRALYRASQAGVQIDLIVRGLCCLRPGIPGVSDRITVRSVVGRFLEHSRLFWFANGGDSRLYIGSADLMERNLDRRVEVLCPIFDRRLATHLRSVVVATYQRDTRRASALQQDGSYSTPAAETADGQPVDAQAILVDYYALEGRRERDGNLGHEWP